MRTFPSPVDSAGAPLRNREPASVTYAARIDETVHIRSGTALDFSGARKTAVPAGARGRIAVSEFDSTRLVETGKPDTPVRIYLAQWAPDSLSSPLPSDKASITAGVTHLSRNGFNAIRIHGLELWLMSGSTTDFEFPADRMDLFDFFLSEAKRVGLYWIINPRQPELYQAGTHRFAMPPGARDFKTRIFTQQDARDHWHTGFDRLYNRVNKYTGINILRDPALYLVECFNECGAQQTAASAWPDVWVTRDGPQGAGAMTWNEWLAAVGYVDVAALNSSWGTSYASIAEATPPSGGELPTFNISSTQKSIDVIRYIAYLDGHLSQFFAAEMATFGYQGLFSSLLIAPSSAALRAFATSTGDSVSNTHAYPFVVPVPAVGAELSPGVPNTPVWEWESWLYTVGTHSGGKPVYAGEYGWPYWGKYRNQYPMLAAYAALQGAAGVSLFYQGDFFGADLNTGARNRTRALFPYSGHTDPPSVFSQAIMFMAYSLGYVSESPTTKTIPINDKYFGVSPRVPGRANRAYSNTFNPVTYYGGLTKLRLTWDTGTTDDTLASTENVKSWATVCAEARAGTGFSGVAVAADNAAYVSTQVNNGTVTAVVTTGTVGTKTATLAQPILTLSGANTLLDGDQISIGNMTGTPGTWPGTQLRATRCIVAQTGVANRVQITSGLDLTAGLSGANFTAGVWSEHANEMQSGTGELLVSRRRKFVAINAPSLKFMAAGVGGVRPNLTGLTSITMPDLGGFFVGALDNLPLAQSQRMLLGSCGNARNTGDTFTAADTEFATVGGYPIQVSDDTVKFTLAVSGIQGWKLYRLQADGTRSSEESLTSADASASTITVTLRTGSIYPSLFWELIKL